MTGQTLGHYRILDLLGSGGMGEVYVAEDTRLGRKVALKTLPPEFEHDAERRQRLEREARAIAALNHPGIVTVYSVEEASGRHFITMELVQGRPLSALIPAAGLPLDRLLEIAVPLVDAVTAAHREGLTHRDLKPANVMVTDDGHVKVLDFGLAKQTGDSPSGASATTMTREGHIVGTVAYMSPEQAQGQPVDARSDIFSLGIVLYEMATGRRPFEGQSIPGTMAAIIESPPTPPSDLRADLPHELARILRRCLAKSPERRYQTARDLAIDLDELRLDTRSGAHDRSPLLREAAAGRPARLWTLAIGAVAAAAGYLAASAGGEVEVTGTPDGGFSRVTSQAGNEYYPRLSPDGEFLVYASRETGNWDIYLKRVGGEKPINLTEDSPGDDTQPAYSFDGRYIAFRSERGNGGLFVMGATGENVRRVSDEGYDPSWSPDGSELLYSLDRFSDPLVRGVIPSELWAVSVATGDKRLIVPGDAVQGAWSPEGSRIAYWGVHQGGQRDIWTVSAEGGEPVQVTRDPALDWNPVWSPDGRYLYFSSDRGGSMNLWRVHLDEALGEPLSEPEPITTPSVYSQHASFSADGRRLAYVELSQRVNLQQVVFDPESRSIVGSPLWITQGARPVKNAELSPDGAWFAFDSVSDQQEDLFAIRSDGTGLRQLTDDVFKDRAPRWSPDGATLAFLSDRSGRYECWTIDLDGSNLTQVSHTTGPGWAQAPVWAPDGRQLACNIQNRAPLVLDLGADDEERIVQVASPGGDPEQPFFAWSWSPDGSRLAGWSPEGLFSFVLDEGRLEPILEGSRGSRPTWLRDNRSVLFLERGVLWLANARTGEATELLAEAPHQIQSLGISHDNRLLYLTVATTEADVWLASLR